MDPKQVSASPLYCRVEHSLGRGTHHAHTLAGAGSLVLAAAPLLSDGKHIDSRWTQGTFRRPHFIAGWSSPAVAGLVSLIIPQVRDRWFRQQVLYSRTGNT